jgi:serine/threonine protein kinase
MANSGDASNIDAFSTIVEGERSVESVIGQTPLPEIPGYRLLSLLGRGGMGEVYLAEHLALRRRVAIKVIASSIAVSSRAIGRFQAESRAVAAVTHSGICQIFEAAETNSTPYLVMEYIEGQTLTQLIRDKPPSPLSAAKTAQSIAEAIHACHQANILHRDLKPANVMLTPAGTIKVMDFGLAKRLGETEAINTRTGEILGTPCYMSPEQAGGVVKHFGPECDVYGIGAILYELLVGRPPHYGSDAMQTMLQVLTADPVAPRSLQARVPRDLETICLKCLAKQPKKRYSTAAALAEDLDRLLTGRPILARPATLRERALKWTRRHPAISALIATGFVSIVAAILGTTFHVSRLQRELNRSARLFSQSQDWGSWLVNQHIPAISKLRGAGELQSALVNKTLEHLQQLELDVAADRQLADYIAQAYVYIADVASDPAFATPEHLEQALESYQHAVSLYTANDQPAHSTTQIDTAMLLVKMSRVQALLEHTPQAQKSIDQAIALLTEATSGQATVDSAAKLALIDAQSVRTILSSAKHTPQENIDAFYQLYLECQALEHNQHDPRYGEVRAALALELGDWHTRQTWSDAEELTPQQNPIAFYQEAVALLDAASQQDERLRLTLTTAATKLSQSLADKERYPEATAALQQAIVQQQQLLQALPESDRFQLNLLSLLDRLCHLAKARQDIAGEVAAAEAFLNKAEALYQSDPPLYSRELRRGYVLASHAHRDSSQEDLASEFMRKAIEQARRLTGDGSQPADRLLLADLLKQQAELLIAQVNKRSILSQRFSALQQSLSLLEESLAIYEELDQATTTELGSPYWLTIELKHRLEDELDSVKLRNQEASRDLSR